MDAKEARFAERGSVRLPPRGALKWNRKKVASLHSFKLAQLAQSASSLLNRRPIKGTPHHDQTMNRALHSVDQEAVQEAQAQTQAALPMSQSVTHRARCLGTVQLPVLTLRGRVQQKIARVVQ